MANGDQGYSSKEVMVRLEDKLDDLIKTQNRMAVEIAKGDYNRRIDGLTTSYGSLMSLQDGLDERVAKLEADRASGEAVDRYRKWLIATGLTSISLIIAVTTLALKAFLGG